MFVNKEETKEYQRVYYQNNKDKIKEGQHRYYEKNKDEIKKKQIKYSQKNKEKISAQRREYYLKNKEKLKEHQREYQQKNKEKIAERKREHHHIARAGTLSFRTERKRSLLLKFLIVFTLTPFPVIFYRKTLASGERRLTLASRELVFDTVCGSRETFLSR